MSVATASSSVQTEVAGHFDVLIVGAGISGIDAAYYLQKDCPEKSFTVLEAQGSFGGTWEFHKYPGVRSDSDLYTFGYKWKPWVDAPIASASEILKYLDEALEEQDLKQHIQYNRKVKNASWDSKAQQWTLSVEDLESGELQTFTCGFLWMCQGYYKFDGGYVPDWAGKEKFKGDLIHPMEWKEDYDYADKEVIVIGSGATAATIVPAMAPTAKHVTVLQRSPTYFSPGRNKNELADTLRDLDIPDEWTHEIVRQQVLKEGAAIAELAFTQPEMLKEQLIGVVKQHLGDDYDVETHFTPSYEPWRQRLAFVPDGDLFKGINSGKASMCTDNIESFNENGILLKSGKQLDADIIISATGFHLSVLGDIEFSVDGKPVDFSETTTYRGCMFSDVPNMAWVFGYFRASWTLRADLISELMCRMFNHMKGKDSTVVTPTLREMDKNMASLPWIDPDNFNPGYLQRGMHAMPKQGDQEPWIFTQDYNLEKTEFPAANLDDGSLIYS